MAPSIKTETPKTEVSPAVTDLASKPTDLASKTPVADQRDVEILALKEKLADLESQYEKVSTRAQLAEMELEEKASPAGLGDSRKAELIEVAALFAAEFAKVLGVAPKSSSGRPAPLPLEPEWKGTRSYRVGAARAFYKGKIRQAGEIVTITDQKPARDWVLVAIEGVPVDAAAPAPVAAAAPARSNDRSIKSE